MRIVTWNINSLRLRRDLLARLVAAERPDVVCLQETKVPDALFPDDAPASLGFGHVLRRGMKGYNGVAILSRFPLTAIAGPDWCGRDDCRHLAARVDAPTRSIELHNFYVPAGGDIPDPAQNPKFRHKLDFVAEAAEWFARLGPAPDRVLVGDLNIAPLETDVWSHRQLLTVVSHTPVEVAALGRWQAQGFADAARHFVPAEQKLFTWWSYRNRDWRRSDRGRRLDHIWVSPALLPHLAAFAVLKDARDWARGSDHVPVAVTLT